MNATQFQTRILSVQDNMLNFATLLTGNCSDANDLFQDTVLKALTNKEKYIDNLNFKGWIFTIMKNLFINHYRRTLRSQTIIDQTEDFYHLNMSQESGFESPDGAFTIKEINGAINHLDSELQQPFSMFVAGYKYNEIADKLQVPLGTVKSRIFFARKELQDSLRSMK